MLARGDEPERRSAAPLLGLWERVRNAPWPHLRWPRRSDFYVPAPVRKLWQSLPPAPPWFVAFCAWFARTHNRNMQIIGGWLADVLPKGLYARALIIIIAPIVVLEGVVAFVFMERHYNLVTRRLSALVTQDVAALVELYEKNPQEAAELKKIAGEKQNLRVDFLPGVQLPPPAPKPEETKK